MKAEVDILMFCLYFKISPTNFLNIRFHYLENTIYIVERSIQNPVKDLRQSVLYTQNAPSQMFDRVLNGPLHSLTVCIQGINMVDILARNICDLSPYVVIYHLKPDVVLKIFL